MAEKSLTTAAWGENKNIGSWLVLQFLLILSLYFFNESCLLWYKDSVSLVLNASWDKCWFFFIVNIFCMLFKNSALHDGHSPVPRQKPPSWFSPDTVPMPSPLKQDNLICTWASLCRKLVCHPELPNSFLAGGVSANSFASLHCAILAVATKLSSHFQEHTCLLCSGESSGITNTLMSPCTCVSFLFLPRNRSEWPWWILD